MITIKFNRSGLDAELDRIGHAAREQTRPAAQAGADLLYVEAKLRCPVSEHAHYFYGSSSKKSGVKYFFKPGTLRDSIYQVFSKDNSGVDHSTYHIAWNHRKAPYGFMVEYGTAHAPAHPFLRPAFDAMSGRALAVARDVLVTGFNNARQKS